MNRRSLIKKVAAGVPLIALAGSIRAADEVFNGPNEKIISGPFEPTWESLSSYKTPEWFRNAKFGIWAHWGPQCQPEYGDWYAREMYLEGSKVYKYHLEKYGHPSKFGFKDVINEWHAELWDPSELVSLYKNAGAKYFMAMANHHDNFDMYRSKYQRHWNSTKIGPKKDIIGGWKKAAMENGLPLGVSVHAAHAWSWMEPAQRADKKGEFAGIPYDGKIRAKDGKGLWWSGIDPQELYEQNHPLSENSADNGVIHRQWNWGNGVFPPSRAYCDKFLNRTIDLINSYDPDLIYFDDTALPLWPASDAGLKIAAHFYNKSIKKNGKVETVIFGKILDELQRKCMVWDIERGQSNVIEPMPWQTDTCIGSWHYDQRIYQDKRYKTAKTVIHILADVVSKNGNFLLNIPVKGNGTIDEIERSVVKEIGEWMKLNSDCIYDTRPWKVFGEGPVMASAAPMSGQGFNEGKNKPFSSNDIRFTQKSGHIYAIVMGWPENGNIIIKSMGKNAKLLDSAPQSVELLGSGKKLKFSQSDEALMVNFDVDRPKLDYAFVLKIV
ncbi:alpha-L-fucosidase [Pedobacter ginsenosidimutans]|uniref:alpha-L-fucosidase n=1 Tax=Pedobacter ginsenosidimutans TaxID=687842 RepID=A0A0T5VVF3_9SPHI|nr:alpha-L-fucosidase [Pedobacter ginsenosidimutans]KRT17835.1 alpha-L-fucosidase [Pedobacter ginsenosidimutans]